MYSRPSQKITKIWFLIRAKIYMNLNNRVFIKHLGKYLKESDTYIKLFMKL